MSELVYETDLKSVNLNGCVGSTPTGGTATQWLQVMGAPSQKGLQM